MSTAMNSAMNPSASPAHIDISEARLTLQLQALASYGGSVASGVARQALTPLDLEARRWLAERYAKRAGYRVGVDAAANLHICRLGEDESFPAVFTGSHMDTQPLGGWLDGAFGVMAGLEVLDALDEAGVRTRRSLNVVAWTNEEGSRFSPGLMGSQSFVQPEALRGLAQVRDANGVAFGDAVAAAHADLQAAAQAGGWTLHTLPLAQPVHAYIEAHIEQGPVLEREGLSLGLVNAIQGVRWYQITVAGRSAHAGTTPLVDRDDAQAKAIALAHTLLAHAANSGDEALRVTIGRWAVSPDSVNTIANEVRFTVDLRHPDAAAVDAFDALLMRELPEGSSVSRLQDKPTTFFDADLLARLQAAADARGVAAKTMVSGAFHDAMPLAGHAPTAMVFAPSIRGVSHHPEENTRHADLAVCTQVLADVLVQLAEPV